MIRRMSYGSEDTGRQQEILQRVMMEQQQQASMQEAILKLTDVCWGKCISTPSAQLTSRENECVVTCAERYMDTSVFITQRIAKQGQQYGQ